MAKPDLGTKRTDPETGKKFYDLNKDPIVSPYTGIAYPRSVFETATKARPAPAKAAPADEEDEVEVEKEAVETVSLEEADDEVAETGAVKVEGDEEEIEDGDEDDTFLAPDDEEDDDSVEDIVGDVDDEET